MVEYLMLKRAPVGVKFYNEETSFQEAPAEVLKGTMPYCAMVNKASKGGHFKIAKNNCGCPGGSPAVGLTARTTENKTGAVQHSLGLYCNQGVAAKADADILYMPPFTAGIELGPVENVANPDVIIVIDTPYNVMRIVQAYSYTQGVKTDYRLSGNQALCSECTAVPYLSQDINLSLLCSGTRFFCKWDEEDMAIGIPARLLPAVVQGLRATLNATEPDPRKERLLAEKKGSDAGLSMGSAYFYPR